MLRLDYTKGKSAVTRFSSSEGDMRDIQNTRQRQQSKSFELRRSVPNVQILNSHPVISDRKRVPGVEFVYRPTAHYQQIDRRTFHVPEPKPLLEQTPLVELRSMNPMADMTAVPATTLAERVVRTKRGFVRTNALDALRTRGSICPPAGTEPYYDIYDVMEDMEAIEDMANIEEGQ